MWVERDLIQKVAPFLKRKEFLSIMGPRQAGKSTFLDILKNYLIDQLKVDPKTITILSFEDRRLLAEFEKDAVAFVESYAPRHLNKTVYLMIDEFQYAEEGGQKLKLIYDTLQNVKILITGSSSLDIKAKVGKFMVGRIFNFHLYPFHFGEYLRRKENRLEQIYTQGYQQIETWFETGTTFRMKTGEDLFYQEFQPEYENFCIWGGYPSVCLAETSLEKKKLLSDIYNNYILKDVRTLLQLATEKNLFVLSQYLATQIGSIVVYQNLSQAADLNFRSLKKHLFILEETFICKQAKPFFKNRQKELSKNPKIYFLDLGFRNNLMENMNALDLRSDKGALIENAVFIRLNELFEGINKINFWRTKAGAEVDFVVHLGDRLIPIEVKYSPFDTPKISRSLANFIDSFKPERTLVLTKNYWGQIKREKTSILFVPVYYL